MRQINASPSPACGAAEGGRAAAAAPARPVLVVMSGLPATGKSTVARAVAAATGAVLVETDAVRQRELQGSTYTPAERDRVYARCRELIAAALSQGRDAVFDATNLVERHRQPLYELAGRHGAGLVVVRTVLPEAEVRRRLERRQAGADPEDRSEALWPVYQELRAVEEPLNRPHLVVDTRDALPGIVAQVRDAMAAARREAG